MPEIFDHEKGKIVDVTFDENDGTLIIFSTENVNIRSKRNINITGELAVKKIEFSPTNSFDCTADERVQNNPEPSPAHEKNNVMRHQYVKLSPDKIATMGKIKDMGLELWKTMDRLEANTDRVRAEIAAFRKTISALSGESHDISVALSYLDRADICYLPTTDYANLAKDHLVSAVMWTIREVTN